MTQQQTNSQFRTQTTLADNYYAILGLPPSASSLEIRQAYRQLSKCYHPDTTTLPTAEATAKFQQLKEAYAILSNEKQRWLYNFKIGYYPANTPPKPTADDQFYWSDSAYLQPHERPLSAGEVFVLFLLAATFLGCLGLAILLAVLRGEPL